MIPDIGVMIAAYVITRMAALLGQPSPQANIGAKILAVLTIIVTLSVLPGPGADLPYRRLRECGQRCQRGALNQRRGHT